MNYLKLALPAHEKVSLFLQTQYYWFPDKIPPDKIPPNFFLLRFSVTTLFRFVARFARVRIKDSSRNRFALNGIQGIACFIVFSS